MSRIIYLLMFPVLLYLSSCTCGREKEQGIDKVQKEEGLEKPQKKVFISETEEGMLSEEQQNTLLEIARKTMEQYVKYNKTPDFDITDPILTERRGCLITLYKQGNLRGNSGYILPIEVLYKGVSRMVIRSATDDKRFPPVTTDELDDIEIEIGVISVPQKISGPDDIQIGKHGIVITQEDIVQRQGSRVVRIFLPEDISMQDAGSKEELLNRLCLNTGLSKDIWKGEEVQLSTFAVQTFREKKK